MDGIYTIYESPFGTKLLADIHEPTIQKVKDFEERYETLVYLIIRSYTEAGVIDSLFYVSQYADEWWRDRDDLEAGFPVVYAMNHSDDMLSEFGIIMIYKTKEGNLLRFG